MGYGFPQDHRAAELGKGEGVEVGKKKAIAIL